MRVVISFILVFLESSQGRQPLQVYGHLACFPGNSHSSPKGCSSLISLCDTQAHVCNYCLLSQLLAWPDSLSSCPPRDIESSPAGQPARGNRAPGTACQLVDPARHSGCLHSVCDPELPQPQPENFRTTNLGQIEGR